MVETAPPILIENLAVTYGDHRILDGLSLSAPEGSVTALLGGNGAGKSTTLSTLLGFVKAHAGAVSVCGVDPGVAPDAARRQIAYLPENVALYEHLTAVENAQYLLALSGGKQDRAAIVEAFAAAGLQERAWGQRLGAFSKGMRQKVAIAVALLREVPVLLLDEPTSGLDPRATADFNALVLSVRERGTAVLMVTHDLLSAADIADRICFLESGRIVEDVVAHGPDRFDVRALHARFAVATQRLAA
ncbi:ABC transporter ATP-binding protein [Novosphingobium panipatense]|uniref:ABC-2 type transport system ATP-binding protein n=1 Tax=Novosphingobium panipatense TaxID=428991 RepID=A0ABY1Q2Y9_9SPHN|nr:ATP-binding cassette domain-containing protein [Novosphingobium panipatense]SMP53155.1 ABC-2 type transport system ATP-binding protein [Novosphingobium panipatense]